MLHRASGFTGALVALDGDEVVLRGHTGLEKRYRNLPGTFAVDGTPTHLVPVVAAASDPGVRVAADTRTASGSRAVVGAKARVAARAGSGSRACTTPSWWSGSGVTTCGSRASWWNVSTAPTTSPTRSAPSVPRGDQRLGVLLDHLVPGTKEARLAAEVRDPNVLVTGTPYVDVWEAIRPSAVGIAAWPVIPKGTDWKTGVCAALGVDDPRTMWRRILGSVDGWKQLEQPFVAAVEQLIDFVTE